MSRIGKMPVPIPAGVKVSVTPTDGSGPLGGIVVTVEGPKGKLSQTIRPGIEVEVGPKELRVKRSSNTRALRSLHGLYRSLLANMVKGVSTGFSRSLEIIGVGYRAEKVGKAITFYLGYSHPVTVIPPEEVTIEIEGGNKLTISGADKQVVGQVAAEIRALKPPEPYKGKGIKYVDEVIRKKAGKTAGG